MDIKVIQDSASKLRAEILRRKAAYTSERDEFNAWRAVRDIGTEWWREQPRDANVGHSDLIRHIKDEWGEVAALFMLLGGLDRQIFNGGVAQYFVNGYATSGYPGSRGEKNNIDLHKELVQLHEKYFRGIWDRTERIHRLLMDMETRLSRYMTDVAEYSANADREEGAEPVLDAGDIDDLWFSADVDAGIVIRDIAELVLVEPA
jgi:hypothetical protein